jgi:hypothetical protein
MCVGLRCTVSCIDENFSDLRHVGREVLMDKPNQMLPGRFEINDIPTHLMLALNLDELGDTFG